MTLEGADVAMELDCTGLTEIPDTESTPTSLTELGAWNLYISHALSTWNVRTYEFAAVGIPFLPSPSSSYN